MNIDIGYVSALVREGDPAGLKGVRVEYLLEEYRPVLVFVREFFKAERKLPKRATVEEEFGLKLDKTPEPVTYYAAKLVNREKRQYLARRLQNEVAEALEANDSEGAVEKLEAVLVAARREFTLGDEKGVGQESKKTKQRRNDYDFRKKAKGLIGLPYPWASFNEATMGMLGGDLIAVVARSGRGKTWWSMIVSDHLLNLGYSVLFHSMEWAPEAIQIRTDALGARVPTFAFLKGALTPQEEKRYKRFLRCVKLGRPFGKNKVPRGQYHIRGRQAARNVLELSMEIQRVQPDFVVCDAAYLMARSKKWDDQAQLVADLKDMAGSYGVPLMPVWQFNKSVKGQQKGGGDQTDIGLTDALVQDSDCVFALFQTEEDRELGQLHIEDLKIRNGIPLGRRTIRWDLANIDFQETAALGGDLDQTTDYDED